MKTLQYWSWTATGMRAAEYAPFGVVQYVREPDVAAMQNVLTDCALIVRAMAAGKLPSCFAPNDELLARLDAVVPQPSPAANRASAIG
ncbi:MAG TPA: hypothetical protein PKV98_18955 [Burkholderiaceae bacterium]|nr:hypothetical protein [Burkholderiaceae bacterium]